MERNFNGSFYLYYKNLKNLSDDVKTLNYYYDYYYENIGTIKEEKFEKILYN
ncbi:MAG TPA: hypothetical protein VLL98_01075 [Rickettsiales bacterium]|nr:hypothetical protein [Rickettsiales bacterium]